MGVPPMERNYGQDARATLAGAHVAPRAKRFPHGGPTEFRLR